MNRKRGGESVKSYTRYRGLVKKKNINDGKGMEFIITWQLVSGQQAVGKY